METIDLIGSAMGLGFVAGVRLYATVFVLGLAIRLGWLHLGAVGEPLRILAHPAVLIAAGAASLIEFFANKVPWVDSLWDSFHAFIRPIGAVVLAAAAFGNFDPAVKVTLIVLCGGVAFASHSSKAATRLLANHSPEPFTNVFLSLVEDALVPFGLWLSLRHPAIVFGLVLAFLAVFLWVAPKIFRAVRLQLVALRRLFPGPGQPILKQRIAQFQPQLKPDLAGALRVVDLYASPLPVEDARPLKRELGEEVSAAGIRAAATGSIKGLGNSLGYLLVCGDSLVFVARRGLWHRFHSTKLADVEGVEWRRGLLMNRLILRTVNGEKAFYLFKDVSLSRAAAAHRNESFAANQ